MTNTLKSAQVPPVRLRSIILLFGLAFSTLLGRAYYLATNPLLQLRAAMVVANAPQDSLVALARESARLEQVSKNLDSMSINAIKQALKDASSVAVRAALDFNAQSRAWSDLRGKIRQDSSTYDALRNDLATLQSIQREEIMRLKEMLDKAQRPSIFVDVWNLALSFILGVLSSLVASTMYERWRIMKSDITQDTPPM